jgi:Fur family peroxide stress response transcriptional regulator
MAFATVYNTLSALMRVGRLSSLSLGGATRFDPNVAPHHHAICERCGKVRDIPATAEDAVHLGSTVEGFEVHRVERIYRGVCGECRTTNT